MTELEGLIDACRPGCAEPAGGLRVLADWLRDRDGEAERLQCAGLTHALADPELTPVGVDRFRCPHDVRGELCYDVVVFRFEPFARAIGLPPGERAADCELVMMPPFGASLDLIDVDWEAEEQDPSEVGDPPRFAVSGQLDEAFLIARTPLTRRVAEEDPSTSAAPQLAEWGARAMPDFARSIQSASRAQWTYAARAGSAEAFCTGRSLPEGFALLEESTEPVEQRPSNAFGLLVVHGLPFEELGDSDLVGGCGYGAQREAFGFGLDHLDDEEIEETEAAWRPIRSLPAALGPARALVEADYPRAQLAALRAVGEGAVPIWAALAAAGLPRLAARAIRELEAIGPSAQPALLALARTRDPLACPPAVAALLGRDGSALEALLPLLAAADLPPSARTAIEAALCIVDDPPPTALGALRHLAGHEQPAGARARAALGRLGAQAAPLSLEQAFPDGPPPQPPPSPLRQQAVSWRDLPTIWQRAFDWVVFALLVALLIVVALLALACYLAILLPGLLLWRLVTWPFMRLWRRTRAGS